MVHNAPSPSAAAQSTVDLSGHGRHQRLMLGVCGLANAADGVEILAVAFILPSAEHDLKLTGLDKGWLTAMIFVGMMIGSYIWGAMADSYGRKPCLIAALAMNGMFGLFSAFAPSFGWLLLFRFFSGFGVGGSIPIVFSYFAEQLSLLYRADYLIYMAMFWMVGGIYASGMAWATIPHDFQLGSFYLAGDNGLESHFNSWRVFLLISAIPALAVTTALFFCVESPTWLIENGHWDRAMETVLEIAQRNNVPLSRQRVREALSAFQDTLPPRSAVAGAIAGNVSLSQTSHTSSDGSDDGENRSLLDHEHVHSSDHPAPPSASSVADSTSTPVLSGAVALPVRHVQRVSCAATMGRCWDETMVVVATSRMLFQSAELRRRSTLLVAIWFTLSFGFYGLTLWMPEYFSHLDTVSTYASSFYTNISNLPGSLVSLYTVRRFGAGRTLAGSMCISGVCVFLLPGISSGAGVVAMSCLFAGVSVAGWNALNIVTTGLFPTYLRSTAFGVFAAMGRFGAITGNLTFGEFLDASAAIPLFTVAVCLSVGGLLTLLLPRPDGEIRTERLDAKDIANDVEDLPGVLDD